MPATAKDMAGRLRRAGGPDYSVKPDLKNPEVSLRLGAMYLAWLEKRTGSMLMALLSYNGGMGRIRRWRGKSPSLPEDLFLETIEYPETRDYGRKVLAAAAAYGYLYYGLSVKAVLADIYN
jgi:soluble lytic murein transglycosylase